METQCELEERILDNANYAIAIELDHRESWREDELTAYCTGMLPDDYSMEAEDASIEFRESEEGGLLYDWMEKHTGLYIDCNANSAPYIMVRGPEGYANIIYILFRVEPTIDVKNVIKLRTREFAEKHKITINSIYLVKYTLTKTFKDI
jgi:hypothetical protein